jgi:hypothetical protein
VLRVLRGCKALLLQVRCCLAVTIALAVVVPLLLLLPWVLLVLVVCAVHPSSAVPCPLLLVMLMLVMLYMSCCVCHEPVVLLHLYTCLVTVGAVLALVHVGSSTAVLLHVSLLLHLIAVV